jgi:hypothetical protein
VVKEKPGFLKGEADLFVDTEVYDYDGDASVSIYLLSHLELLLTAFT